MLALKQSSKDSGRLRWTSMMNQVSLECNNSHMKLMTVSNCALCRFQFCPLQQLAGEARLVRLSKSSMTESSCMSFHTTFSSAIWNCQWVIIDERQNLWLNFSLSTRGLCTKRHHHTVSRGFKCTMFPSSSQQSAVDSFSCNACSLPCS